MIRFALQSERLGPKLVQNSKVLQTFDLEFTPPTAGRPGNTPSCRKMVRKIHSKLPLQPAESKTGRSRPGNAELASVSMIVPLSHLSWSQILRGRDRDRQRYSLVECSPA